MYGDEDEDDESDAILEEAAQVIEDVPEPAPVLAKLEADYTQATLRANRRVAKDLTQVFRVRALVKAAERARSAAEKARIKAQEAQDEADMIYILSIIDRL